MTLFQKWHYIVCYLLLNTHAPYHASHKNNVMDKCSVETKMNWTTVIPYGTNQQ